MTFDVIYLNGGKGTRCWPLTLVSPLNFYSKSMFRILGQTLAEIQLNLHSQAGARNVHVITQYDENREDLGNRLNQERKNIYDLNDITWTHPEKDIQNTGSADALFQALVDCPVNGTVVILPNDNHLEYDIEAALAHHEETQSLITILTTMVPAREAINNYGIIVRNAYNSVKKLEEKPKTLDELANILSLPDITEDTPVTVSGGAYIADANSLRSMLNDSEIQEDRKTDFDIAKQLIPYVLSQKRTVQTFDVTWSDLGGLDLLLRTVQKALDGQFPYLSGLLNDPTKYVELPNNVWIHNETYRKIVIGGKTLIDRLGTGEIKIGPNVFIGRNVSIYPGANISYSEIGKDSMIGTNVVVDRSYLSPGTQIAYGAVIHRSITSPYSKIGPSTILKKSVIGRANIPTGVELYQIVVWPNTILPEGPHKYADQVLFRVAGREAFPEGYWPNEQNDLEQSLLKAVTNL